MTICFIGRASHENRSVDRHSAYSYLIYLVRQGVVTGVDRRGSATVKREILHCVSVRFRSIVGASLSIIERHEKSKSSLFVCELV